MSIIKRNKGRDPAAIASDPHASLLVQKFLKMKEVDYIRNVVIPTLEAEGFERIDFHHGTTEVGKDLIFSKDMGFGKKSLVVAVVKNDRLSKSSSDNSGFPVFLVQVSQAKRNEVLSWDGTKKRPDKVLVIFADDPSHDVISSNPGGFQDSLADGVEFILGTDIATSLLKHRRDIAEQLLESKLDTSMFLKKHPTNLPLLHALHSSELVDIKSIFTDLDAAVGTTTIAQALSLRPSGVSRIEISDHVWTHVSHALHEMEKNLGSILVEPLDVVKKNYLAINQKASSPANTSIWRNLNNKAVEIENLIVSVHQELDGRKTALNEELKKFSGYESAEKNLLEEALEIIITIRNGTDNVLNAAKKVRQQENVEKDVSLMCDELDIYCKYIESNATKFSNVEARITAIQPDQGTLTVINELGKSIRREHENAQYASNTNKKILEQAKRFVPNAKYEVEFDVGKFRRQIEDRWDSLIERFKSEEIAIDREYSRRLLEDTRRYLALMDSFVSVAELSSVLRSDQSETAPKLGACILGLLDSGIDVLVTGDAGSGKSTTLEMFAHRYFDNRNPNEEVVFLPLAKLALPDVHLLLANPLHHLYEGVSQLFRTTQPGVTSQFVMEKIERSSRLILIFDGIDEATGLIAWILKLIEELKMLKKEGLQIVASSRFGVPQLEAAGLFRIQLLPFRQEQVVRFIGDFLRKEPSLASEVIEHLERNPTMFSVAKTPLMSTILCILAQNSVVLPETKSALYKERFELLWGAYDAKKQVRRINSSKACLEDVSKKAAYYLHSYRIRSALRNNILDYVQESLARKYKPEAIRVALEELERPCNVLFEEIDGTIGFGHLSYQEYLTSDELYTNRTSDIVVHLTDSWWRGVLVLAAMKAEDIGSIIEQRIIDARDIGAAEETLQAMIEVSHPSQKNVLSNLLNNHKNLDHIVDSYDEDLDDPY